MERPSTILIVDDDPLGRKSVEGPLKNQGYTLTFAASGAEAISKAIELNPDLILLDVIMPDMNGFEVCKAFRKNPLISDVPIIIITSLDDQESRIKGIDAGADDLITKPFNRLELRAKVKTITRLNRYKRLISQRISFKWVVDNGKNGYVLINNNDKLIYANLQACLFLGIDPEQYEQNTETFFSLVQRYYHCEPNENWEGWPQTIHENLDGLRYLVGTYSANKEETIWIQVTIHSTDPSSDNHYLIQLRDITNQVTSERNLSRFNTMLENKMLTPLKNISDNIALLSDEQVALSQNEAEQIIDKAYQEFENLNQEIDDILEFITVPDNDSYEKEFQIADLPTLSNKLSKTLGLYPLPQIIIHPDLKKQQLAIPPKNMEIVLRELFDNSKKFHPNQQPTIEISITPAANKMVRLQVNDNGISLSPFQLQHIWAPYYQIDNNATGQSGLGLGLSTIAAIIWKCGGIFKISNRDPGPGISIELEIPQ